MQLEVEGMVDSRDREMVRSKEQTGVFLCVLFRNKTVFICVVSRIVSEWGVFDGGLNRGCFFLCQSVFSSPTAEFKTY